MTVHILTVGKLKEPAYHALCREYEKRLRAFAAVTAIDIPEARLPDNPSRQQINAALEDEAARLRRALPRDAYSIALCVEGARMDSLGFSKLCLSPPSGKLAFLVGGSNGLAEGLKKECSLGISFSDMTFPHHLFRVMLYEQIYRAFMIHSGRAYHK